MEEASRVMRKAKGERPRAKGGMLRRLRLAFCLLYFTLLAACSSSPSLMQVSHSGAGAFEASLTTDDSGFIVAWHDMRDGNAEIYLRSLDVEGRPSGPERRLTDTPDASYEASVERLGDALIIAWYEQTASGEQTAMLGEWDRDGAPKWMHPVAPASRNPVVRTDGRSIFCAWIQGEPGGGEAVWAGWWSPDGQEHRPRARLGPASKNTWNLNASLDRSGTQPPNSWRVPGCRTPARPGCRARRRRR
jgi:hypothetical protein